MAGKALGAIVILLLVCNVFCQRYPPEIKDSYIAWGEVVEPLKNSMNMITLQNNFEESYDSSTNNSVFILWFNGEKMTFTKNYATNQTFAYAKYDDDEEISCREAKEKEWDIVVPDILTFEGHNGSVKFSLNELLNLNHSYLKEDFAEVTTYRGIPALCWTYEITKQADDELYYTTFSIDAFWSDGSWNTSAGVQTETPLGFNVTQVMWSIPPYVVTHYVLSVFGFVSDAYDHKYFKPIQGIECETRKSTLKFPNVKDIKAISLHYEMSLPDYQEIRYTDTWFDPQSQLVRVDTERMIDDNPTERREKHYQSEIAIGKMGVVYRLSYYKGEGKCEVITFDKYVNDFQNLFDIKQNLTKWKMGKIFGLNETSYVYLGKTTKNEIPCHLFQGRRTDWPDAASNFTSLWEWCFNMNDTSGLKPGELFLFDENSLKLINADVTILSDPKGIFKNYRLTFHFYQAKVENPKLLDATQFDIGRCFSDTQKRMLHFYLNFVIETADEKLIYENATSDVEFLQKWKAAIYNNTGLQEYSQRISSVGATIDNNMIYIKFSILPVHDDLPENIKSKQMSIQDAERTFKENVNNGKVSIQYRWKGNQMSTVTPAKNSVLPQIDEEFEPQTLPPTTVTTPTVSTHFHFSLETVPDKSQTDKTTDKDSGDKTSDQTTTTDSKDKSSSTTISGDETTILDPKDKSSSTSPSGDETTTIDSKTKSSISGSDTTTPDTDTTTPFKDTKELPIKYTGHQKGSVAGVSIAMLLVGVTIGASGIFFKLNGLPSCCRR